MWEALNLSIVTCHVSYVTYHKHIVFCRGRQIHSKSSVLYYSDSNLTVAAIDWVKHRRKNTFFSSYLVNLRNNIIDKKSPSLSTKSFTEGINKQQLNQSMGQFSKNHTYETAV